MRDAIGAGVGRAPAAKLAPAMLALASAILTCVRPAAGNTAATVSELGLEPTEVVTSAELGVHFQNTFVVEEPATGQMLVANSAGLLSFDGARWRTHRGERRYGGFMLSAAPLAPDTVLAPIGGALLVYRTEPSGVRVIVDESTRLPAAERDFTMINDIRVNRDGAWMPAGTRLVLRRPDGSYHSLAARVTGVFAVGEQVLVQRFEAPMAYARWDGERIVLDESAPQLERADGIGDIVDLGEHGLMYATADGRLWRHLDGRSSLLPGADQELLKRLRIRDLERLRDGHVAAALLASAPIILDREGRIVRQYGDANGVPDERSFAVHESSSGALWVAQQHAIVRIDRHLGISVFDRRRGISNSNRVVRHRGRIFAGDLNGLRRLQPGANASFVQVSHASARAVETDGEFLWFTGGGLNRSRSGEPGELERILEARDIGALQLSRHHPDRLYGLSVREGLYIVEARSSAAPQPRLTRLGVNARDLVEEDAQHVWLSSPAGLLQRIRVSDLQVQDFSAEFDQQRSPRVFRVHQQILVGTDGGVYRWTGDQLLPAEDLNRAIPPELRENLVVIDEGRSADELWLRGGGENYRLVRDGEWRIDLQTLAPLSLAETVFDFYHDAQDPDVLWVSRSNGVVRVDLAAAQPPPRLALPLARALDGRSGEPLALAEPLGDAQRDLRFEFALNELSLHRRTEYRSQLLGYDPEFSAWGKAAERNYTNLPFGSLQFRVEARDAWMRTHAMPELRFQRRPPWFRTPQAYAAYALAALWLLWLAMRLGAGLRQRQMLVRQRQLEAIVALRTAELRASNAQLAEQAERLAAVDRLKTRFFVNVGHEFRTPLTLVLGPLDDLLRDTRERLSERVRAQLQLAQRNARRVLDLIVELLDVNRLEQGQLRLDSSTQDLRPLLARVARENAPLVERFGQTLVVEPPGEDAAFSAIDAVQVERALSNLIGNAAKYSPRGTTITLSLAREGAGWTITVRDQGRGIAPAALPHVFDRFFQTDGSATASGYGIGLSLVREIALAHGGEVRVHSTLGVGSSFDLRLPAVDAPAGAQPGGAGLGDLGAPAHAQPDAGDEAATSDALPQPGAGGAGAAGGRERVLVVDDHADLRQRVREILGHRFEVIEAEDGQVAWQLARDELPDLIVSDVMMPGCDGVELSKRLRSNPDTEAIGILLLTAKVGSEHAVAGLRAGANDYLAKPFDASELLARCEAIVAHARRLQHRLAAAAPAVPDGAIDSADSRWRQRLDQHIAANLHEPGFNIEALARCMHADRSQLFRKCKEALGQSPSEYLRDTRLAHGHRLLEQAAGNVSEIAYASGFDSLSSFTRAFKARYGIPPSQVRARLAREA